jgi:hypothetical protein
MFCRYADANLAQPGSWREMLRLVEPGSCDFVNLGIVVDRGQQTQRQAFDAARQSNAISGSLDGVENFSSDFLVILANELRFGLRALTNGGSLYFAYQTGSNMSLLYRLLQVVRPAFARVRLTPTFAAHRTPVYVFLGEYAGVDSEAGAAALAFLDDTPTEGPAAFVEWHVTEWSESVTALHEELADDLHHVWRTQLRHLHDMRIRAEREFGQASAR